MTYSKPKACIVKLTVQSNSAADNKKSCNDRGCCVLSLKNY